MRFWLSGPRLFGGMIRPGVSFPVNIGRSGGSSAPLAAGDFVYVVRNDLGHIKIGISADPAARLQTLQTGSAVPLAIVGATWAGQYALDVEQEAHAALERYRLSGEWFATSPEIAMAAVYASAARLGVALGERGDEGLSMETRLLGIAKTAAVLGVTFAALYPLPMILRQTIFAIVVVALLWRRWTGHWPLIRRTS